MKKLFLIAAGVLILAGCGDDPTNPEEAKDYFPVSVGNQWNHSVDGYIVETRGDTLFVEGTVVQKVERTLSHNNGRSLYEFSSLSSMTFIMPDTTLSFVDTSYSYLFDADSELISYEDSLTSDYEIVMKFPPTVGEKWEPMTDDPSITREVVSISSSVSVPAGNYSDCLFLEDTNTQNTTDENDIYVAGGIGPIKYSSVESDSLATLHMEITLESYVIN